MLIAQASGAWFAETREEIEPQRQISNTQSSNLLLSSCPQMSGLLKYAISLEIREANPVRFRGSILQISELSATKHDDMIAPAIE